MTSLERQGWSLLRTALVVSAALSAMPASAACAERNSIQAEGSGTSVVHIDNQGADPAVVSGAIDAWETCSGYGIAFPAFSTGGGEARVQVFQHTGPCPIDGCGCGRRTNAVPGANGGIASADIHLYSKTNSGASCAGHEQDTLAHELGHILGLRDSTCPGYIMSGFNPTETRSVQPEECMVADQQWKTPAEVGGDQDPDKPMDDGPCGT